MVYGRSRERGTDAEEVIRRMKRDPRADYKEFDGYTVFDFSDSKSGEVPGGEITMTSVRESVDDLGDYRDQVENGDVASENVVNALDEYEQAVQEAKQRRDLQNEALEDLIHEANEYIDDLDQALYGIDLSGYQQELDDLESSLDEGDDLLGVDTSNP